MPAWAYPAPRCLSLVNRVEVEQGRQQGVLETLLHPHGPSAPVAHPCVYPFWHPIRLAHAPLLAGRGRGLTEQSTSVSHTVCGTARRLTGLQVHGYALTLQICDSLLQGEETRLIECLTVPPSNHGTDARDVDFLTDAACLHGWRQHDQFAVDLPQRFPGGSHLAVNELAHPLQGIAQVDADSPGRDNRLHCGCQAAGRGMRAAAHPAAREASMDGGADRSAAETPNGQGLCLLRAARAFRRSSARTSGRRTGSCCGTHGR